MTKLFRNVFMALMFLCATSAYAQTNINPAQIKNVLSINGLTDTGSANVYVVSTGTIPYTSLVTGTMINFKAANSNTGSSVLSVNGLAAKAILKSGNLFNLAANDIRVGQEVTVVYDGVQWEMQSTLGNATSGNPAAGNPGDLQDNAGGGVLGVAPINNTGSLLKFTQDTCFSGVNPYVDITCFGARPVFGVPSTTAVCSMGSPTVTIGNPSSPFQNGDGVILTGCGATNTLSTPNAPTVIPSVATSGMGSGEMAATPAGSTTYAYKVSAITKHGGLTAASSAGTTTTGLLTLGIQTSTVTTMSRSNATVTVTTSAPNSAAVGAIAYIHGSTSNTFDASFTGHFPIASVIDNEHFTVGTGMDTRGGAPVSATGGVVTIYPANHIVISPVANAQQYYVWGSVNGGSYGLAGVTKPGESFFDDFSYGPPSVPFYIPATPPASATNDYLSTTIVSGAGTSIVVVANNAVNNTPVSGSTILFDDGPAFTAAWNAVNNGGTLTNAAIRIPATSLAHGMFVINSHLTFAGVQTILQDGPLALNETMDLHYGITWDGVLGGTYPGPPQFAWSSNPQIVVGSAYPGFTIGDNNNGGNIFKNLQIISGSNGFGIGIYGGFNHTFENDYFTVSGLTGIDLIVYGTGNLHLNGNNTFNGGGSATAGADITPAIIIRSDLGQTQPPGNVFSDTLFLTDAGVLIDAPTTTGSGQGFIFFHTYSQGAIMPLFMFSSPNSASARIEYAEPDTAPVAIAANWNPRSDNVNGQALELDSVTSNGADTAGFPGIVTGKPFIGLRIMNSVLNNWGQNISTFQDRGMQSMIVAPYSTGTFPGTTGELEVREPMRFPAQNTLYWDMTGPTTGTCSVSAGGAVPIDTWSYYIAPIDLSGSVGTISGVSATCTDTSGNQTNTVTVTGVPGASGYILYRSGAISGFQSATVCSPTGVNGICVDSSAFTTSANPVSASGAGIVKIGPTGVITPNLILSTHCVSVASPATCVSAVAGYFNIPSGTSSVVVDTSSVTANSIVSITFDSELGTALGVTCNTTAQQPYITARTPGTSFTVSVVGNFSVNPGCFSFSISN